MKNFLNKKIIQRLTMLSALILATSEATFPSFAHTTAEETSNKSPSKVSKLLKELKAKQAVAKEKIKSHAKKPIKAKTKPAVKRHKTTKIKPKLVKTNKPTHQAKKRSLPDFLHNIYIRGDYGVGTPKKIKISNKSNVHFKKTSMYSGGIGYKFNQAFRADINFQCRKWGTKTTPSQFSLIDKVDHTSIFLNTYLYLMDEKSYITPFITAGIGYTKNKIKDRASTLTTTSGTVAQVTSKGKATSLAWNVGTGAALKLTKNLQLEAAYKFIDIGKVNAYNIISTTSTATLPFFNKRAYIHEISGGLVINF